MVQGRTFQVAVLLLLFCYCQRTAQEFTTDDVTDADESHIQNPLINATYSGKIRFRGPLKCTVHGAMTKLLSWGHDKSEDYSNQLIPLAELLTEYSALHASILDHWHKGTQVSRSRSSYFYPILNLRLFYFTG